MKAENIIKEAYILRLDGRNASAIHKLEDGILKINSELVKWQTCAESLAAHIRPESERRCSALIHFDELKSITVAEMPNVES